MKAVPFFIAWRYVWGTRSEKNISLMITICFVGICIGSFALALITSIMNGFEKVTHEKMQGIHAQLTIASYAGELDVDKIKELLKTEFPDVIAASPHAVKQVIIQHRQDEQALTSVAFIKAIDPQTEPQISSIASKIIKPSQSLPDVLHEKNSVIIGDKLAQALGINIGEKLTLLFSEHEELHGNKITLQSATVHVTGTFAVGIDEFDTNFLFCSLQTFKTLFPESGPTHLSLTLSPQAHEQDVIQRLQKRLNLNVYSWKDLYPALVAALKLDKYVSFFVLMLITLVASMNIISLLFMLIIQKRVDIAVLQAMGMSKKEVNRIFYSIGLGIATFASMLGLALAFLAGFLLDRYPFITLPDAYYVTQLPVRMEWYIFAAVFVLVVTLSFGATAVAIRRTRTFNISYILRLDA